MAFSEQGLSAYFFHALTEFPTLTSNWIPYISQYFNVKVMSV